MTNGSPLWQIVFLSFAAVLLLLEVLRGYRLGLPRQLMRGAAIIAAYAAAYFGGPLIGPLLQPILNWPEFILSLIAGAILALIIYGLIASLGTILFKRTAQHSSGSVRLIYGTSGALAGVVFGLFFLWLVVVGIRSVGSIADAQVQAHPRVERQPPVSRAEAKGHCRLKISDCRLKQRLSYPDMSAILNLQSAI